MRRCDTSLLESVAVAYGQGKSEFPSTNPPPTPIMLKHDDTQLLSPKELAWRLNRHSNYVYLMRKAGFPMPGYRATLESA